MIIRKAGLDQSAGKASAESTNINNVIFQISIDNRKLYKKALYHAYERRQFTDLVVNRIIRSIHKYTGVTLCEKKDNNQKRVLKK